MKRFYGIYLLFLFPYVVNAQFEKDANNNLYYLDGNVGIGTANPSRALEIYNGTSVAPIRMTSGRALYADSYIEYKNEVSDYVNARVVLGQWGSPQGEFWILLGDGSSNPVPRFFITNQGNVGIGTTTPSSGLEVKSPNGGIHITDYGSSNYLQVGGRDIVTGKGFVFKSNTNNTVSKQFSLYVSDGNSQQERLTILKNGSVGIGTTTPGSKLTVAGNILAREVKVTATAGGADFVFEEDYDLPGLKEVAKYIKTYKHLPGIPSAETMESEGLNLAEMNIKLLQKVEELTLYVIDIKDENEKLKIQLNEDIAKLSKKIEALESK